MPKRYLCLVVVPLISLGLLTLVSLARSERCDEITEPTCTEVEWLNCQTICASHGGCQYAEWNGDWCWDGVCFESWTLWCNDGYYEERYCAVQKPRVTCDY